mgnify:CR=1 FL=1
MIRIVLISLFTFLGHVTLNAQQEVKLKKKDRKRDVLIQTNMGDIVVRLSDSTPLHRDNFLKLIKSDYYEGVLFHRVISKFMIQAGDPDSKNAEKGKGLGNGGPGYTVPAEFVPSLFHKKGVLAAARKGDDVNPERASSGSQFYIVVGKVFTPGGLDSLETYRLKRKIPQHKRDVYTSIGGTPHLDDSYTIFGETIKGLGIVEAISEVATSKGADRDRPLEDVRILKTKLIKRKK